MHGFQKLILEVTLSCKDNVDIIYISVYIYVHLFSDSISYDSEAILFAP